VLAPSLAPCAASAQDRTPAQRKQMLDLAYVLGEVHALKQACTPEDQTWRERMQRMLEVEAPDSAFSAQLATRFNDGYTAQHVRYPKCDPHVAALEAKIAREGKALADALAGTP
jgi:uncharacterized protein (TIGR02301 family)